MAATTLLHFPGREEKALSLLPSFPLEEGWGEVTMTTHTSTSQDQKGRCHDYRAASFWKWYEDDHGHTLPFLKRREAETMASFHPSF